jgi:hypothetical protein
LGQLRDIESQLEQAGFRLLAIAPDRPEKLGETADKYRIRGVFLSDSSMAAARAFRIAYEVDAATLEQLAKSGIDLEAASGERHHQLPRSRRLRNCQERNHPVFLRQPRLQGWH